MADPIAAIFGGGPVINSWTKPIIKNPTMRAIGNIALPAVGYYLGGPAGAALGSMAASGAEEAAGIETGGDIGALKRGAISGALAAVGTGLSGGSWTGQAGGWGGTPSTASSTIYSGSSPAAENPSFGSSWQYRDESSMTPVESMYGNIEPAGGGAYELNPNIPINSDTGMPMPYRGPEMGATIPLETDMGTPMTYGDSQAAIPLETDMGTPMASPSWWDRFSGERNQGLFGNVGGYYRRIAPYMMGAGLVSNVVGNVLQAQKDKSNLSDYINATTWTPSRASTYQTAMGNIDAGTLAGYGARAKGTLAEQMAMKGRGGGGYGRLAQGIDMATLNALANSRNQALTTVSTPPNLAVGPFMSQTNPWASTATGISGVAGNMATTGMNMYLWDQMMRSRQKNP